jgi:hypothetical protein
MQKKTLHFFIFLHTKPEYKLEKNKSCVELSDQIKRETILRYEILNQNLLNKF